MVQGTLRYQYREAVVFGAHGGGGIAVCLPDFVTKIQNIGNPLATKPIEERDDDDAEDKRTIE